MLGVRKSHLVSVLLLGSALALRGQGTLYFTAHLTGNTSYFGDGTFSLTTNRFGYDVLINSAGFDQAQIRSPWPDTNASVVFDLFLWARVPPLPDGSGDFCRFRGVFYLTDQQIIELQNANWFVYSSAGPDFFLRGQIVPIPEPAFPQMPAVGIFTCAALMVSRRQRKPQQPVFSVDYEADIWGSDPRCASRLHSADCAAPDVPRKDS